MRRKEWSFHLQNKQKDLDSHPDFWECFGNEICKTGLHSKRGILVL